jgi:ABC-2 type transport system ATP-binding protein
MAATVTAPLDPAGSDVGASIISCRDLTKRYGELTAVDHLTLDIRAGEVFGLLGPNGAGKTTTILMMLGLTEPTSGSLQVAGHDPRHDPLRVKSMVGYLPDEVGFYDDLTAVENLRYTAALNRLDRAEAEQRIARVLDDVGLTDDATRRVGTFSRGMLQRLGVADALVKNPAVLVLDEPTVNIDPEGVRELLLLVERLRSDDGVTVLLSSHLLHQVQQVCDRIGIFVAGSLRACGTLDELAAGLGDRWVFEVGVAGLERPGEFLSALAIVESAERVEGHWLVRARGDLRQQLDVAVGDAGGYLTHLTRRGADLDAIYHRYFGSESDDRHDAATA